MNEKRIKQVLKRDDLLEQLEQTAKIESQIEQLTKDGFSSRNTIETVFTQTLADISKKGNFSIFERAAFSAVFDMVHPAHDLDNLVGQVHGAFSRLLDIHSTLRKVEEPMLAYGVSRMAKLHDHRPISLVDYSYRNGDGSGLIIDERVVMSGALERYTYDVYIPEISTNHKHSRRFGMTYHDEPIVFGRSPARLLDWADGPESAAKDLDTPPKQGKKIHILIGSSEIEAFFDISRPNEQYDTLYGHAALMGFDFK
jgi:hypothetical protein